MQMIPTSDPSYTSYRFIYTTPDGVTNIHVTEANPLFIQINIGKAGTSVASWAYALAELTNLALESHPLASIIDKLKDISTSQSVIKDGVECRSTAEAVGFALTEYSMLKLKEERMKR